MPRGCYTLEKELLRIGFLARIEASPFEFLMLIAVYGIPPAGASTNCVWMAYQVSPTLACE
jgi:hypothetical protein